MAYYKISSYKDGRLKAKIQATGKDPQTGQTKLYVKTVVNTSGLTEAKFKKLVEKESIAFEEEVKKAYSEQREQIRTRILTFPQLMQEWKENIRINLSISYYERAESVEEKFNEYLKLHGLFDAPISEITVRDIQLFINQYALGTYVTKERARLIKPLPKGLNYRQLARDGIITRQASYYMKQGNTVAVETARTICELCGIRYDLYFSTEKTEKQYAQETVKGMRRILRAVFNEAVRYDWISRNPVSRTKIGAGSNNVSLRPISEKEVFSTAELKDFVRALDNLPEEAINNKVMVKLMLFTGIRNAELHGLRWEDIDLERGMLSVKRNRLYSKQHGYYEKSPKTKTSVRDIPLPELLVKALKEYYQWFQMADSEFPNKQDAYYVAVNIRREPECPTSIGGWLSRFEKSHGFKHVSCHGLRHTYCSMLLSQNVPIQTVSKYMGHSDSTVTLSVYSHFVADTQERAVLALNNILSDTTGT